MLIEAKKTVKPSNVFKYPWIGTVVDNADPKKLGRLKISIPGLMEGDSSSLPWAMMENATGAGGTGADGSFIVPKVGSKVNVHFMYDDLHFPVYRGFYQSSETHQTAFDNNYPEKYGFQAGETKVVVDRATNELEIETANGVKLKISSAGDVELEGPTKVTLKSPEITFNEKISGITTANSHMGVIDFITGIQVLPSPTTFGDV